MIGAAVIVGDNQRLDNQAAGNGVINNNRRRELLFLFYFVLIFIAVRIWIIIISSSNEYVIILSAIFTGLIFALLCFRCRTFPRNNGNVNGNRNEQGLNDFQVFLMQTGNIPNSRNAANDSAMPLELIESMECFVFKGDRDSVDQNINSVLIPQSHLSHSPNKVIRSTNGISDDVNSSDRIDYVDEFVSLSSPITRTTGQGRISNANRTSTDNLSRLETGNSWRISNELESISSLTAHGFHNNNNSQVSPFPLVDMNDSVSNKPSEELLEGSSQHVFNCSICLSDYQMDETLLRLPCYHIYHKHCVTMWFQQHNTCPLCKQNVFQMMVTRENAAVQMNAGSDSVTTPPDHSNTTITNVPHSSNSDLV